MLYSTHSDGVTVQQSQVLIEAADIVGCLEEFQFCVRQGSGKGKVWRTFDSHDTLQRRGYVKGKIIGLLKRVTGGREASIKTRAMILSKVALELGITDEVLVEYEKFIAPPT